MALDYSVMEKKPLVKDLLLNPLGKEHPARILSAQGTPGSARNIFPRLNLCTWRNLLARIMGWVVGSLLSHSFAFRMGLKPTFNFKAFHLGRVMASSSPSAIVSSASALLSPPPKAVSFPFGCSASSSPSVIVSSASALLSPPPQAVSFPFGCS